MEDKEILEKIRNHDTKHYGFNLLVKKYQKKIYWHIRKMVIDHDYADDVSQDTFVKIWKNVDSFQGDSKLYTWIYRIATNECLNFLKKKGRRYYLPIYDINAELSNKLGDGRYIDPDELQMKLQKAILKLPRKQQMVFNMKYFDEMKYEEMSDILETSVGALKASYHQATKKIKKYIAEN